MNNKIIHEVMEWVKGQMEQLNFGEISVKFIIHESVIVRSERGKNEKHVENR